MDTIHEPQRRAVLKGAMALAIGAGMLPAGAAPADAPTANGATPPPGRPGEFDFLHGEWKIRHRRQKRPGEWDEFEGEATCWTILGGVGSVEELRIPSRDFAGMGLRLLDVQNRVWNDFWVNAKSGVLTPPGMPGYFRDGAGIFIVDEMDDGKPIKVRGLWDGITPTSHRWTQSVSRDGGATWEDNWLMEWTRVA